MDCPSYEQLAQVAFGAQGQGTAPDHLAACPRCTARMEVLERMRQALAAGDLPDVPEGLRRAALELSRPDQPDQQEQRPSAAAERAARPSWRERLSVLVAELMPAPEALPAIRRASVGERRRLYRAGDFEIDLVTTDRRKLLGQVIAMDDAEPEDARCTLVGERVLTAELSPTGEFQFHDVGRGTASLTIEWGDVRLLLPEVELPD